MAENLIINFTPTGMIPTKEMTPFVPVSVSEIVEDVHKATKIGITMVLYMHVNQIYKYQLIQKKYIAKSLMGFENMLPN